MESNKILSADILDIIFEGKNKEFGAYELRKTYNKRLAIAIVSMAVICLLLFITQLLANNKDGKKELFTVTSIKLVDINKPDEKRPEPKPVPPPKVVQPKVEIKRFTAPEIVEDIKAEDPPPVVDELENSRIGLIDQDGVKEDDFVAPPVEKQGTGLVEAPKNQEETFDKIFTKVEKEAKFPGGLDGWKRYLERNLNGNVAADDGAPTGKYTVKVQFIVDKEGNISNVEAIDVPKECPTCGPEAVKVIKRGPKWEPAVQNDRKVIYQAVQYVTFQVAEE